MRNHCPSIGVRSDENLCCYIVFRIGVWQRPFSFSLWQIIRVCHPWQTSLEHWVLYRWAYILSQLCKMLILPNRSHCGTCPLPTIQVMDVLNLVFLEYSAWYSCLFVFVPRNISEHLDWVLAESWNFEHVQNICGSSWVMDQSLIIIPRSVPTTFLVYSL